MIDFKKFDEKHKKSATTYGDPFTGKVLYYAGGFFFGHGWASQNRGDLDMGLV